MTKRERKWLKGDKWMSFMGGEPFRVPAHHWFMRRRCARMQLWEYIRWKHQQVVQSNLNELWNLRMQTPNWEIFQLKELDDQFHQDFHIEYITPEAKPPIGHSNSVTMSIEEYHEQMKAAQFDVIECFNRWSDILREAKSNQAPTDERSVATDPQ